MCIVQLTFFPDKTGYAPSHARAPTPMFDRTIDPIVEQKLYAGIDVNCFPIYEP